MKFFIVLLIVFANEPQPLVYKNTTFSFLEIETCNTFIESKKDYLNETINSQFKNKTIKKFEIACMSEQQFKELVTPQIGA